MFKRIKTGNIKLLIAATVVISMLSSCFKEDKKISLAPPGPEHSISLALGSSYSHQDYFDLGTEDTMGGSFDVWDLAFEASDTGWHIWINGGNQELVANTDTQHFAAITDTAGAHWRWDEASWNPDSTAIGDWRGNRFVYLLDRGPGKDADERFKKIIFQTVDNSKYEIQFANLDGSGEVIYDILKDDQHVFKYFTFNDGGKTLPIEPETTQWDLLFTRYRYIFYTEHPPLPYLVTGVLINPNISVAVDSVTDFDRIDYPLAETLTYTNRRDIIGYNWKKYNFTSASYTVIPYYNYVIKDMEGVYWKLHFIDFYNSQGLKGYPQFVFQRL